MLKKFTGLVLAAALIAAVFTAGGPAFAADSKVYTFNVNITVPEASMPSYRQLFTELEQESGGRLKFDMFWAGSLVALPDIPRAIRGGTLDISMLPTNNYTSQMPLNSRILQFPFMGLQGQMESVGILTRLQKEFPAMQKEFDDLNMVNLGNWAFPPYHLNLGKKKEVRLPTDLRGLKIMSSKLELQDLFAAAGAAQVQISPAEVYTSLEKNVIDGYINNYAFAIMFGLTEITTAHTELGGWIDFSCTVMNKARFNELPPDLQALITKKFDEKGHLMTQDQINLVQRAYAGNVQRGNLIVKLTEAELNEWKKLTLPAHEKALVEISRNNPTARDIYKRAQELIAETFK